MGTIFCAAIVAFVVGAALSYLWRQRREQELLQQNAILQTQLTHKEKMA